MADLGIEIQHCLAPSLQPNRRRNLSQWWRRLASPVRFKWNSDMGFCFSCCRRRRSPEQQPLLSSPDDNLPPARSHVDKAVDVLAALNAGKLPSQDQLSHFLQIVLRSDILRDSGLGYGPVSANAKKVLDDSRELVEALLQLGLEKNCEFIVPSMPNFFPTLYCSQMTTDSRI